MGCTSSNASANKAPKEENFDTIKPTDNSVKTNSNTPAGNDNTLVGDEIELQFREKIEWIELAVNVAKGKDSIIGEGSFGTVVKAVFKPNGTKLKIEVAVKVLTKSLANVRSDAEFQKIVSKAIKEVDIIRRAEKKMIYKDCVIRTYGVTQGPLPKEVTNLFKLKAGEDGVGIIMRLEKGGSLDSLIHGTGIDALVKKKKLTFTDKINILFQCARGIAELHAVGIVHADIKPDNVLLDDSWPPQVRLADFGFATFREMKGLGGSSIMKSKSFRGTPLYSAPEMLINPYKPAMDGKVAKASRKTDVYAFAMMAWEVLTESELFPDIMSETVLCSRVHQGSRPPLEQLPKESPQELRDLLAACWDGDRKKRKTAIECLAILQTLYLKMTTTTVDVVINRNAYPREALDQIYHQLTRNGLTVVYEDEMGEESSMRESKIKDYRVKLDKKSDIDKLTAQYKKTDGTMDHDVDMDVHGLARAAEEHENQADELENGDQPQFVEYLQTSLQPMVDRLRKK